jgi:hypothetical protein
MSSPTLPGGVTASVPSVLHTLAPFTIAYSALNAGATVNIQMYYAGSASLYGILVTNTPNVGIFSGSLVAGTPSGQAYFVILSSTNSSILGRTNTFTLLAGCESFPRELYVCRVYHRESVVFYLFIRVFILLCVYVGDALFSFQSMWDCNSAHSPPPQR